MPRRNAQLLSSPRGMSKRNVELLRSEFFDATGYDAKMEKVKFNKKYKRDCVGMLAFRPVLMRSDLPESSMGNVVGSN
jgi:hypothetical protein